MRERDVMGGIIWGAEITGDIMEEKVIVGIIGDCG